MSRGRGIAQLIIHMSHLTPVGWGYFACSVLCSALVYQSSKKVIPFWIRKQAVHSYPSFEWIVIPQYGVSLSFALFLTASFFLGYFCDSNDREDDIAFFMAMSFVFFLICSVPSFCKLFRPKCFMCNNGAFFISRFAPLGLYKRITIQKDSIVETMEGKDKDVPVVRFQYNGGKKCKLRLLEYSMEGQKILSQMLGLQKGNI